MTSFGSGEVRTRRRRAVALTDIGRAFSARNEEENRHADGEAIGDLLEDDGAFGIGDVAIDLDTAIDGAGMHDQDVGLGEREARLIEAEKSGVLADAGKHGMALTLVLDAQEIDDIGVGNRFLDIVGHFAAHLLEGSRDESGRSAKSDIGTELPQRPNVGAGDTAIKNVAENGDIQAGDLPFFLANSERIEECLCRMFMRSITGVDDAGIEEAR